MTDAQIRAPDGASSLLLLVWTSPAFPVGAFAYSHGLERAVERGDITDAAGLRAWLGDLLDHGAPRNDAILARRAWVCASNDDGPGLREANALAVALASSRERHLETTAQGNAFLVAARAAWPCAALDRFAAEVSGDAAYPVVFAAAAGGHGIACGEMLEAFTLGVIANLVSAAVRLGAIGQTDAQRVTAALIADIRRLAAFSLTASLDDLGGAAYRSDLAALQHETQYSRLFRS